MCGIVFDDVHYSVPAPSGSRAIMPSSASPLPNQQGAEAQPRVAQSDKHVLLNGITGLVMPGDMLAIMGPTGAPSSRFLTWQGCFCGSRRCHHMVGMTISSSFHVMFHVTLVLDADVFHPVHGSCNLEYRDAVDVDLLADDTGLYVFDSSGGRLEVLQARARARSSTCSLAASRAPLPKCISWLKTTSRCAHPCLLTPTQCAYQHTYQHAHQHAHPSTGRLPTYTILDSSAAEQNGRREVDS